MAFAFTGLNSFRMSEESARSTGERCPRSCVWRGGDDWRSDVCRGEIRNSHAVPAGDLDPKRRRVFTRESAGSVFLKLDFSGILATISVTVGMPGEWASLSRESRGSVLWGDRRYLPQRFPGKYIRDGRRRRSILVSVGRVWGPFLSAQHDQQFTRCRRLPVRIGCSHLLYFLPVPLYFSRPPYINWRRGGSRENPHAILIPAEAGLWLSGGFRISGLSLAGIFVSLLPPEILTNIFCCESGAVCWHGGIDSILLGLILYRRGSE